MKGLSSDVVFEESMKAIPQNSWSYRAMRDVKQIVEAHSDLPVHEIADLLLDKVAVTDYFYADLAPEAVSLAMASVLYGRGDFARTLLFAVNLGRDADTIAAMAGAVAGALAGYEAIPENWKKAVISVGGTCLQFAKGLNPYAIAEELVNI